MYNLILKLLLFLEIALKLKMFIISSLINRLYIDIHRLLTNNFRYITIAAIVKAFINIL